MPGVKRVLILKRIDGSQALEAAEIAVGREQLRDAVLQAQRCDVGVMDEVAGGSGFAYGLVHHRKVVFSFSKQRNGRRRKYFPQVIECNGERNGRMKNPRMRHDTEKLVNAGPGYRPGKLAFGQPREQFERRSVVLAGFNFGVNEDVCIDRLHDLPAVHEIKQRIAV